MNKQRLKHGVEVLRQLQAEGVVEAMSWAEGDHPRRFNINMWGYTESCRTVACVAGWFTLDPVFREQGLLNAEDLGDGVGFGPRYTHLSYYDALEAFFGIDTFQAEHIFSSVNSNRIDHAVERIEEVIAEADRNTMKATRARQEEEG